MLLHAFDFLERPQDHRPAPVTVLFGNEWFLHNLVFHQLRAQLFSDQDVPHELFDGETVAWRDVADELATYSLFSPNSARLALLRDADSFVSQNRAALEEYVSRPITRSVLVLMVTTFPSNTRLYKAIETSQLGIECRAPEKTVGKRKVFDEDRAADWLISHAERCHDARLTKASARLLLEMGEPDFGRLDQELAKLAAFVGAKSKITPETVRDCVGGWRAKTAWEMLDAGLDGQTGTALQLLNELLHAGENPIGLLAQISYTLRQLAAATRIYQRAERAGRRMQLRDALTAAGVRSWPIGTLEKAERHLKQLGRPRATQLYKWLLEADLALKGSHSSPERARWILERLILRIGRQTVAR
jgi:DNA polymerase-3 subunit delta